MLAAQALWFVNRSRPSLAASKRPTGIGLLSAKAPSASITVARPFSSLRLQIRPRGLFIIR